MAMIYRRLFCLGCLLVASSGCLASRLNKDSVEQAITVGDLEQQEVLDNVAMFVYDCNSMPYFSYPNQGSAVVSDQEERRRDAVVGPNRRQWNLADRSKDCRWGAERNNGHDYE